MLENKGQFLTNYDQLKTEITKIFGIYNCHFELFYKGQPIDKNMKILSLNGALIYVIKIGENPSYTETSYQGPVCKFINIEHKTGEKSMVLLENPQGDFILNHESLKARLEIICKNSNVLLPPVDVLKLNGCTLQTDN